MPSAIEAGIVRAKNARQKRKVEKAAPKVFENTKSTILIKGGNVSQTVTDVMHDLHRIKVVLCNYVEFVNKSFSNQIVLCTKRKI